MSAWFTAAKQLRADERLKRRATQVTLAAKAMPDKPKSITKRKPRVVSQSPVAALFLDQALVSHQLGRDLAARAFRSIDSEAACKLAGHAARCLDISYKRLTTLQKLGH